MTRDDLKEIVWDAVIEEEEANGWHKVDAELVADRAVPKLVAFVAAWLSNQSGVNIVAEDCDYTVKAWREEMGDG